MKDIKNSSIVDYDGKEDVVNSHFSFLLTGRRRHILSPLFLNKTPTVFELDSNSMFFRPIIIETNAYNGNINNDIVVEKKRIKKDEKGEKRTKRENVGLSDNNTENLFRTYRAFLP